MSSVDTFSELLRLEQFWEPLELVDDARVRTVLETLPLDFTVWPTLVQRKPQVFTYYEGILRASFSESDFHYIRSPLPLPPVLPATRNFLESLYFDSW